VPLTSIEPQVEASSRIAEIRRRIRDRYYDRPEVRRVLSHVILRRLARAGAPTERKRPESA
jgi:hypothetical protein